MSSQLFYSSSVPLFSFHSQTFIKTDILFALLFRSFQGSPSEDRHFRSDIDEAETEVSFSGQDESSQNSDILEWAKVHLSQFIRYGVNFMIQLLVT